MLNREGPTVAIIGAGFGGLATAVKLTSAGIRSFTVFEKSDGPGGTWWDNRYPGCEVDVPSAGYSFTFMPFNWSRTHARADELRSYAKAIVERFDLDHHIRYGVAVESAAWDKSTSGYLVATSDGRVQRFQVVVSAVGMLNVPKYPDWPGLDAFNGPSFHTARWEDHDLRGKRVAVIGTGSSAAQIVPEIAEQAKELLVFQREPGWVIPKRDRDYSETERKRNARLDRRWLLRTQVHLSMRQLARSYDTEGQMQRTMRRGATRFIEQAVEDPAVRAAVTPAYPFGCKRPVVTDVFFPALNRPNVSLIPKEVVRVAPSGVVDADGDEHEVDVLILATGFKVTDYLDTFELRGASGQSLHEYWNDRPRAFLGITVPDFPNFFIIYGPNTNGCMSILSQHEIQASMVVRAIRRLRTGRVIDTRPAALARWVRFVDQQCARRQNVLEAGCGNYYHSASGANVTQWPLNTASYFVASKVLPRFGLRVRAARARRSGVFKVSPAQPRATARKTGEGVLR